MKIISLITNSGDKVYYDRKFIDAIYDHADFLKTHHDTTTREITRREASIYYGDFFGLLDHFKIEKKYHFSIMIVNGFKSSEDFNEEINIVYIPSTIEIDRIKYTHMSKEVRSI